MKKEVKKKVTVFTPNTDLVNGVNIFERGKDVMEVFDVHKIYKDLQLNVVDGWIRDWATYFDETLVLNRVNQSYERNERLNSFIKSAPPSLDLMGDYDASKYSQSISIIGEERYELNWEGGVGDIGDEGDFRSDILNKSYFYRVYDEAARKDFCYLDQSLVDMSSLFSQLNPKDPSKVPLRMWLKNTEAKRILPPLVYNNVLKGAYQGNSKSLSYIIHYNPEVESFDTGVDQSSLKYLFSTFTLLPEWSNLREFDPSSNPDNPTGYYNNFFLYFTLDSKGYYVLKSEFDIDTFNSYLGPFQRAWDFLQWLNSVVWTYNGSGTLLLFNDRYGKSVTISPTEIGLHQKSKHSFLKYKDVTPAWIIDNVGDGRTYWSVSSEFQKTMKLNRYELHLYTQDRVFGSRIYVIHLYFDFKSPFLTEMRYENHNIIVEANTNFIQILIDNPKGQSLSEAKLFEYYWGGIDE